MTGPAGPQARVRPPLGRVLVIIPTYNEAENLEWIVGRLRTAQPGVDVMVVDDNSPDGTGRLADRMAAEDPAITVVHRTEKAGLGAAYLNGFDVALDEAAHRLADRVLGKAAHLADERAQPLQVLVEGFQRMFAGLLHHEAPISRSGR